MLPLFTPILGMQLNSIGSVMIRTSENYGLDVIMVVFKEYNMSPLPTPRLGMTGYHSVLLQVASPKFGWNVSRHSRVLDCIYLSSLPISLCQALGNCSRRRRVLGYFYLSTSPIPSLKIHYPIVFFVALEVMCTKFRWNCSRRSIFNNAHTHTYTYTRTNTHILYIYVYVCMYIYIYIYISYIGYTRSVRKVSDPFFAKRWWILIKRACMRRPWTFIRMREFFPVFHYSQLMASSIWAFEWGGV